MEKDYKDKLIEETMKDILKLMWFYEKEGRYRIHKSKVHELKLPLHKLFHLAFKEGVYVGKS